MSFSSKMSRKGIEPLDMDLSRAVFNIKRKVMFNVDRHLSATSSSGALSANAAACTSLPTSNKNITSTDTSTIAARTVFPTSMKVLPSPVEILFNPFAAFIDPLSEANVGDVTIDHDNDPFTMLVNKTTEGLLYHAPELCDEGENGTYFLRDRSGKKIAVFKCADEEGVSSPKRKINPYPLGRLAFDSEEEEHFKQFDLEIAGESEKQMPSVPSSITDCVRNEVAAHVLDLQSKGFYSVPQTGLVAIHPFAGKSKKEDYFSTTKVGSLQEFVESDGSASDVGPVLFPVREVHKIGILDLQIINLDRHLGNILIKNNQPSPAISRGDSPFRSRAFSGVSLSSNGQGPANSGTSLPSSWPHLHATGEFALTPIDHGYSLPRSFSDVKDLWFEWITFPQAKRPFDEETKRFIDSIDIETNARALKQLGVCEESIAVMKITTTLLKKCAAANWTLYDIAMLLVNSSLQDEDEPSALEDLATEVDEDYQALLLPATGDLALSGDSLLLDIISQKIDDLLQQHQEMLSKQQRY